MSTPSTATATLPHSSYNHHQQYYPQEQPYPPSSIRGDAQLAHSGRLVKGNSFYAAAYPPTTPSSQDVSRRPSASGQRARQLPLPNPLPMGAPAPASVPASAQAPGPAPTTARPMAARKPDARHDRERKMRTFYNNRDPREIEFVEISDDDDDDDPPPKSGAPASRRKTQASTSYAQAQHNTSLSTTHTPHSSHPQGSASANATTAPTSLGSQQSNGRQASPRPNGVAGQKRKRTRAATQDEANQAKRRELDQYDPFSLFNPPPNPPIKAGHVHVPVVPDRSFNRHQQVDDADGHYIVVEGTPLADRYEIVKLLGQGTFGKVVEAVDKQTKTKCAIKVIRSVPKYRDASKIELRVLSTLKKNDANNANRCIHLRDCFDFRNHICIVTDLYSQSVFDFLKANSFVPFPSSHIQKFAKQLFTSVAFLHDLNLIHTDLKPENILLVNNAYQTFTYDRNAPSSQRTGQRHAKHRKVLLDPEIRLIDFGSATFEEEYHSSIVSTRHYRAPEIILNLGWSFPCDIWSIGCILVEFFTGDALFQTHENLEHLAMMEAVMDRRIERDLIRQVKSKSSRNNSAASYFRNGRLDWPNHDTTRPSKRYVSNMKRLQDIIPQDRPFNKQFLDLLKKIFVYDPAKRITAKQALQHPWFRESFPDDGTEAHRIRLEKERKARAQAMQANRVPPQRQPPG